MKTVLSIAIALAWCVPALADRVVSPDADIANGGGGSGGTRENPPLTAKEMTCLMQKNETNPAQAQKTAEALAQALQILNLDNAKLTRICMMHFLAQIKAESGNGASQVEGGGSGPGVGLIQVTGSANLRMVAKCMNEANPGMGNGVVENPKGTIGSDPLKSATASLCWWRENMLNNPSHLDKCLSGSPDAADAITHIVNGGSENAKLSKAAVKTVGDRMGNFEKLKMGEPSCRQWSI